MRFASVALAIALVAGLAGCVRTGQTAHATSALTIVQQREPMSLNPALENGTSSTEWGMLLFQYLVKYDDRGRLVGDAAMDVPSLTNGGIAKDGRTITYHLRPGLRFADGTPLTAADCVWSIRAVQNPANDVQTRYGYDHVVSASAPNAGTLVLHLAAPFAPLLTLVLAPQGFPILPAHLLAKFPDFNHVPFDAMPLGSGPYVVTAWRRGDRVEMRANPYYYRGTPKIENLTIRFATDPNTAVAQMRTGEADGLFDDEDLGNYPVLRGIPGVRTTSDPIDGVGALIFNTQDPVTSDPRVRHAIAEAIDIHGTIARAYRGALDSRSAGRGLFVWAFDPHAYPDIPFDLTGANALLDRAGWKRGADGTRAKDGRSLDLLFAIQAQTPGDEIIGNVVAQAGRAIGARITLKAFGVTQFVAPGAMGGPVYGGKFQIALYPFVNGDDPDTSDQFLCDRVPPNGYNKSRFCDPQLDALLERARITYDVAVRKALYAQAQAVLYDRLPIALLYQRRQVNAFSDRVVGQTTSLSGAFWNVGAWSLRP
jgi:peptide/nickel transport system substrate-binding protein